MASEGRWECPDTGAIVDLRLDWAAVDSALAHGSAKGKTKQDPIREEDVLRDFPLTNLDPTQRAVVDRGLE